MKVLIGCETSGVMRRACNALAARMEAAIAEDAKAANGKQKSFKPMLAATCEDITKLKYPVLVSPKLDGIRCIIRGGVAVSRNLKPIPNKYVQEQLKGLPDGLDGELIVGPATGDDVWNRSQSGVMSSDGEPDFCFWVFDHLQLAAVPVAQAVWFEDRLYYACDLLDGFRNTVPVEIVPHVEAKNFEELASLEAGYVHQGFEGLMVRDPNGLYKFGRSTVKEGGLLKVKRWHDAEAIVLDFVEQFRNDNVATKDELGRTKRSTHKANKVGKDTLGALVCTMPRTDFGPIIDTFEIGTGFDDATRAEIWVNRDKYKRAIVTFKYQSLTPDGVPRFPVFKGFRHSGDIS